MKYEKSAKERPLESLKELLLSGAELFGDKNAFLIKKEKAGDSDCRRRTDGFTGAFGRPARAA